MAEILQGFAFDPLFLTTKQEFEECENRKIAEHKTYRKVIKLEDLINYYPHSVFREKGLS